MSASISASDRELLLTRVLHAPREQVFDAWTQAEHIVHWWGPKDFSVPHARVDASAGGEFRVCLRSPEGVDYWTRGAFREIRRPSKLVFSWAWEDDPENSTTGKPGHETEVTLTFEDVKGKTLMTFRQRVFETIESRDSHEGGWSECFDRLEAWLSSEVAGRKP